MVCCSAASWWRSPGTSTPSPDSLSLLYVAAAIGGVGAGVVYGTCVGNALKWFPDRRGLAAGLTAAGFGAGSALTVIPIANMIATSGYQSAFLWFGLGQGLVVVVVALFLRAPQTGDVAVPIATAVQQTRRDYGPKEVVKTPVFWVMYLMFVLVGAGGLMATAQLAPIAKDFNVGGIPVSILGLTLPALTFALSIDRVLNGICRPFFGWVSDNIGRENTMFIAFLLEGIGIYALFVSGDQPALLRDPVRPGVLRLGRDLLAVPGDRAPTSSAASSPPRTTGCCTRPRARRRCWCRSPMCLRVRPAVGTRCSSRRPSSTSSPRSWRWWCSSRCASRLWPRADRLFWPQDMAACGSSRGRLFCLWHHSHTEKDVGGMRRDYRSDTRDNSKSHCCTAQAGDRCAGYPETRLHASALLAYCIPVMSTRDRNPRRISVRCPRTRNGPRCAWAAAGAGANRHRPELQAQGLCGLEKRHCGDGRLPQPR